MATQIINGAFYRDYDEPACNVVRLPTAAPRKVDNNRFKEQRRAASVAREHSPFHERYVQPCVRAAMPDARLINDVVLSPALLIAEALLAHADPEMRAKIVAHLAPGAVVGSEAHQQAVAIIRRHKQCLGDKFAFDAARALVAEEGY